MEPRLDALTNLAAQAEPDLYPCLVHAPPFSSRIGGGWLWEALLPGGNQRGEFGVIGDVRRQANDLHARLGQMALRIQISIQRPSHLPS